MAWLDGPCTGDEQRAWRCTDAYVENTGWPWTCDKMTGTHGGTNLPACSASFRLSRVSVSQPSGAARTVVAGGVAAAGLAGLAYLYRRKTRGGGTEDAEDREMLSAREDGLHPIPRPRGKRLGGGGRPKRATPVMDDDDDDDVPMIVPSARAAKGAGTRGAAAKQGGKRQGKTKSAVQGRRL